MIAVDANVLFDLLFEQATAEASMLALGDALAVGPVVMCSVVVAELSSRGNGTALVAAAREMGILYSAVEEKSAIRAGEMMHRYRQNGGGRGRTIPDFVIGAHALLQCSGLITLDAGFTRQYFKGLAVINPTETAMRGGKSPF